MKFATQEDVAVPADQVFAMLSQFDRYERMAQERGITVTRTGAASTPGVGLGWDAAFALRGKPMSLRCDLVGYDPSRNMVFDIVAPGFAGCFRIDLAALDPARTQMGLELDLSATSVAAKVLMQSLKLAKPALIKKLHARVVAQARMMEQRYGARVAAARQ